MIKAKRLEKGNTIGVVSPASPSENHSEIVRAKEYLENLGYKVVIGRNVNKTKGFTAASEQERADDIVPTPSCASTRLYRRSIPRNGPDTRQTAMACSATSCITTTVTLPLPTDEGCELK